MEMPKEIIDETVLRQSIRPIQRAYKILYAQLDEALAYIEWLEEFSHIYYWGC